MVDYTYLVNDIIQASENEGTEFINYIPNMVNRAEERLTKDFQIQLQKKKANLAPGS